ncbi:unnamed protein product [Ectocarpus fasciculatus]
MGKDSVARVWYVASVMTLLTGDSCGVAKQLQPFGAEAALSVQNRELQDSCGDCGTEIVLNDDEAEMSCTFCNEAIIACMSEYGDSETGSGGFGICHPCGDLSVEEVVTFYEGLCGDPLSDITQEYVEGCLYYLVPPECPSDMTSSDDYTVESSDDSSTDDDWYTSESSDDSSTDDDWYTSESSDDYWTDDYYWYYWYTVESGDDSSTDDDWYTSESSDDSYYSRYYPFTDDDSPSPSQSPSPSPFTDEPITKPTTTVGSGVRVRACGSVGALAVALVNVVFFLTEMR